jgi:anti-anti-sigma factor
VGEDAYPVRWTGRQAVVTLPELIGVSNAGQIREQLLVIINRGAAELIADMAATISCDHAGADALARAHQRAALAGAQLRLVVTAQVVRRVLAISGLDRLVSIYPSLEAATAPRPAAAAHRLPGRGPAGGHAPPGGPARTTGQYRPPGPADGPGTAMTPAVVRELLDALDDGVALAGSDGILALASGRLEEMFGYQRDELAGRPVESLLPARLQSAHRHHRAGYAQAPSIRPMGAGAWLVGLRQDGTTFPVQVSLAPLPTDAGRFTIAVIRDLTQTRRAGDLAGLDRAAAAEQEHRGQELLDRIVHNLFSIALSLQAPINEPGEVAEPRITGALQGLDDTIREIRDHLFTLRRQPQTPPAPDRSQ